MGLMNRLLKSSPTTFRPDGWKANPAMQAILQLGPSQAKWMASSYQTFATEGYMQNPYVYACIRQISMAVAGIPWRAYHDETKKKEYDDHPLLDLLHRPNPRQAGGRFFETLVGFLLLDGNSYILAAGPTGAPPDEMYCLRPDRMRILPGTTQDPIAGFVYSVAGVDVPFPTQQVLQLPLFHPLNDWYGLSPLQAASRSVDQSNQAKQWNMSLLQNGARPTGALSTPLSVEDIQYQRLKELIEEQYSGFMNAGRPLLLEGGLSWQAMGLTPADMHWIEGQKLDAREIAMVYNIAPELVGDPESKTFSNYQEARKALYEENILPLMDWLRDDFNQWLAGRYSGGVFIDYDKDEIEALAEDRTAVWTRNNLAYTAGWITINDAREAASMDRDPTFGDFYKWQLPVAAPYNPATNVYPMFDPDAVPEPRQPILYNPTGAMLPYPNLPPDHPLNAPALPPPSPEPTTPPNTEPPNTEPPNPETPPKKTNGHDRSVTAVSLRPVPLTPEEGGLSS